MGLEYFHFRDGIVHYSTVDAVFCNEAGEPISMSFHPFCGPVFEDTDDKPVYPDEDDPLWEQFNGWWEAKGRAIYRKDSPVEPGLLPLEIK